MPPITYREIRHGLRACAPFRRHWGAGVSSHARLPRASVQPGRNGNRIAARALAATAATATLKCAL